MKRLSIDSAVYSAGIFLNSTLGLVYYLVIARALGPESFGILAVTLAVAIVAGDVFDFGLNTAIVGLLPAQEVYQQKRTLSANFLSLKILLAVLTAVIGIFISPLVSSLLFGKTESAGLIILGFISASVIILFGYVNSHLLAQKKFLSSVILNVLSNGVRLLGVFSMIWFGNFTVTWAALWFVLPTALAALVWFMADKTLVKKPAFDLSVVKKITHFGKWVAASLAVGSVSARVDNFILTVLAGATQTGFYTAVQRFFLAFNQIPAGIGTVLAPSFSARGEHKRPIFFFGVGTGAFFTVGLLILTYLCPILVPWVLGAKYLPSVVPAQILALATIPFVLSVPLNSYLLYARKNSRAVFLITLAQLLADLAGNYFFVPAFGAAGSAVAYGLSTVTGLGLYSLVILRPL